MRSEPCAVHVLATRVCDTSMRVGHAFLSSFVPGLSLMASLPPTPSAVRCASPAATVCAGPSGRGWVMRWLPARAYDSALFIVFANPIGLDDGQLRNGNAMVIDPFGEACLAARPRGLPSSERER